MRTIQTWCCVSLTLSKKENNQPRKFEFCSLFARGDRVLTLTVVVCTVSFAPVTELILRCKTTNGVIKDLELPAFVTLTIIDEAVHENSIRMWAKWELITAVKHFRDRRARST
jgi:hypothetical protein